MSGKRIFFLFLIILYSFNGQADFFWNIKGNSNIENTSSENIVLGVAIDGIKAKSVDNKIIESLQIKGLKSSQDLNLPQVPFKSFLVAGDKFKFEIEKGNKVKILGIKKSNLVTFNGEKCRCKNVVDNFSLSSAGKYRKLVTNTYLGDFRGQKIYKIDLSPVGLEGDDVYVYPNLKVVIKKNENVHLFENKDLNLNKKMLIVAPYIFDAELQTFINFKRSQGFEVSTLILNDKISFNDLKNAIHKKAREQNISYLIVVGNEKTIPTNYVMTNFEKNTPSDLELTTLGGTDDYIPDILSSRISVSTINELRDWIQKTIGYEQTTVSKLRTIALASNEGANPSDVDYVKSMAKPFKDKFSADTTYFFQGNQNSTPENISEAINSGVDFINYIGHGSGFSWPSITDGEMTSDHLKALKNEKRFPVVIDVACQNGRFSGEDRFGESFINNLSGAVAYYGGSVDISWDPPAIMAVGISTEMKKDEENILGLALLKGQLYLMKNFSDFTQVKYNLIWYHLQGDPSLKLNF